MNVAELLRRIILVLTVLTPAAVQFRAPRAAAAGTMQNAASASSFNMTVNCVGSLSDSAQAAVAQAEAYWESVLTGYNSSGTLAGLTVSFGTTTFSNSRILGDASVDSYATQGGYWYSERATILLAGSYVGSMSDTTLYHLVLHELGHALGFGTTWTRNGVYVDGAAQYTGAQALAAYRAEFQNQSDAAYVPVETDGIIGTAYCHWDESYLIVNRWGVALAYELMTGHLDGDNYVSNTTIQSFADIGYLVVPEPSGPALWMIAGCAAWLFRSSRSGTPHLTRTGRQARST